MRLIEPASSRPSLERGFALIKKGDLGAAITVMDELIREDPYLAQAYWGRALCYDYRSGGDGDLERAISDYTKSIVYSAEPSALAYGRRGILYFRSGLYEDAIKDLNKALAADLFWSEAQFYRGRTYLSLSRGKQDLVKAEDDFTEIIRALPDSFAPAYFWRAQARRLLGKDHEAVADYESALKTDPDDVLALNALGFCSEYGIGTNSDAARALELYKKAAELGYAAAQKNLAWLYGEKTAEAAARSSYWLRQAALSGDPEAQNLYALRRLGGVGTSRNEERAAHYFRLAAEQGYEPAICNLADCFELGVGVQKDPDKAFAMFKNAAGSGSKQARYHLGRYYYFGIGTAEDNGRAFALLKPLADEGFAKAQDMVGMCYEDGYGVARDFRLAGRYYRAAYRQGHISAGLHLGLRYLRGRGVKKNLAEAERLLMQAAESGSSYGRLLLGKLYLEERLDFASAAETLGRAFSDGEESAAIPLARALLLAESGNYSPAQAHRLLLRASRTGEEKLSAAVFLCDLELMGAHGFTPKPAQALERLDALVAVDEFSGNPQGVSCAYVIMAQARELGLGVPRDADKAAALYLKAGDAAKRESGRCRCFVASFAHMLYTGVSCEPNIAAADKIILDEMQLPSRSDASVLLYIWSRLRDGAPENEAELVKTAECLCKSEPRDALSAYMMYYLKRKSGAVSKYKKRLMAALNRSSPYIRHKIGRHMAARPDEPLYPMLTAEDIDEYEEAQKS